MNGTQITKTSLFHNISHPELAPAESSRCLATRFMHPDEVMSDLRLTRAEKREILACWASDVRAIPDAPALRQLDNGAVVRIDDVLRALKSLDENDASEQTAFHSVRSYAGLRIHLSRRLRLPLRRGWPDDDDDPPPCPVVVAKPPGGPLSGGEAANLGLAPAG